MNYLENTYQKYESKMAVFLDVDYWHLRAASVSIAIMLLSFFSNVTPLGDFRRYYKNVIVERDEYYLYRVTKDRSENLTGHIVYQDGASNNRVFRLALPVMVKVLRIKKVSIAIYGLQLLLGVLMYFLMSKFLFRLLDDKIATLLCLVALACIYFGTSFFIECNGYGDFYSFFLLFLAMYFRNPLIIFTCVFTAAWCDERAWVASGLIFLWWWISPSILSGNKIRFKPTRQMISILASIIGYALLRFYLIKNLGMNSTYVNDEFTQIIKDSIGSFGFKFMWLLEGLWLLIILATAILYTNKDYLKLVLFTGGTLIMPLLGLVTFDSTRSGTYVFPMVFIALLIVRTKLTVRQLRILLTIIALLCFLHPLANKTRGVGYFLM